jgi:hypothetical protein
VIIAALALLADRTMEYSLILREATLMVVIAGLLTLLVLLLLIYLRVGGRAKSKAYIYCIKLSCTSILED